MQSPILIQAALLAKLEADAGLTAVTTDIREASTQLTEFTYPNVRYKIMSQIPATDGNCHLTLSDVMIELFGFSEQPSSQECQNVLFLAHQVLYGQTLSDATFRTVRFDSDAGPEGPVRVSPRVWRARASLFARAYPL